ncbi:MAG TPA: hypothetical protein VK186_11600, partial [Candidatus Deferrimicrobium sp.]|nr:hypothetical protein [Candidatus Deferrimicrobium sp.]
ISDFPRKGAILVLMEEPLPGQAGKHQIRSTKFETKAVCIQSFSFCFGFRFSNFGFPPQGGYPCFNGRTT